MVPAKDKQENFDFMEILNLMLEVRSELFKDYSELKVLEVVLSLTLNYEELIAELYRLIYE